jgi:Ribosomal silencing factor during starvation
MHVNKSTERKLLCAGAKALRYLLKQTRTAHGVYRPVRIAHDGVSAWFSVTSGPVSVHCMSREVREQLDLEELWGKGADLTWFQKGPSVMTLDTIGAGEDSESGSDRSSELRHDG